MINRLASNTFKTRFQQSTDDCVADNLNIIEERLRNVKTGSVFFQSNGH